jgi:hypothetical protein
VQIGEQIVDDVPAVLVHALADRLCDGGMGLVELLGGRSGGHVPDVDDLVTVHRLDGLDLHDVGVGQLRDDAVEGRIGAVLEPAPEDRPGAVEHAGLPIHRLGAGDDLGQDDGGPGEVGERGGGPRVEGAQKLRLAQGGGSVCEERVQGGAALGRSGVRELGPPSQLAGVAGHPVRELHELGMALDRSGR